MPEKRIQSSEFRIHNWRDFERKNPPRYFSPLSFRSRGFTLIELLVVMAIIGILSTIILANYNNFGSRQEVKNATEELKSNLRKYQTLAISGQKNPDPGNPLCYNPSNPSDHILDYYSVVINTSVAPPTYTAALLCQGTSITVPLANGVPWSGRPIIESVGRFDVASGSKLANCSSIVLQFQILNRGLDLVCGGFPVVTSQGVYVTIRNPEATVHYDVFVTSSGDIYEQD